MALGMFFSIVKKKLKIIQNLFIIFLKKKNLKYIDITKKKKNIHTQIHEIL